MDWDLEYSHYALNEIIKDSLYYPDTFDHIQTLVEPVDELGNHLIRVEFSAVNLAGLRVRRFAGGVMDNETCSVRLVEIQ